MSAVIDQFASDVSQSKPKLLAELIFWPAHTATRHAYRIEVPTRHKFYSVGYEEYVFISMFDGNTTVAQACGRAAQTLGREALTQREANAIVRWLIQNALVSVDGVSPPAAVPIKSVKQMLNPFWIKIPLPHVDRGITAATAWPGMLFAPISVKIACLIMISGLLTIVIQWDRFVVSSAAIFSPSTWAATLATWIVLKFVHELAHAAAARRYGCETTQVGIVLVLFAPLAYVDVTTSWRLRSKWQRITIAAAGMYVELTIAALAAIVWGCTQSPILSHQLFNIILAASVSTILFNANPLMRFDGYFILADLLQLPNLAGEGSLAVRDIASRLFFARSTSREQHVGWRRGFVIAYGICAMIWRGVICVSLALAAAFMFHGAGVVLVGFGLFAWVLRPLIAMFRSFNHRFASDPAACLRAVIVAGCLIVIAAATVFYMPLSTAIVTPAVIDQGEDVVIRSRASGFVRSIRVVDGQYVQPGDILMQLENDELQHQAAELETKIGQSEIRNRTASETHDIAAVQMEQQARNALLDRLNQIRIQIDGLTVRAHRGGTVVARGLSDRLQRYVEEGSELLSIVKPADRRVLASISQTDIRQVTMQLGKTVDIMTASRHRATGRLLHVKPLATTELNLAALAAVNAGPLAVRPDEQASSHENAYRLIEPRFEAIIRLDPQQDSLLPIGQTVRVQIGRNSSTLYQRAEAMFWRLISVHRSQAKKH